MSQHPDVSWLLGWDVSPARVRKSLRRVAQNRACCAEGGETSLLTPEPADGACMRLLSPTCKTRNQTQDNAQRPGLSVGSCAAGDGFHEGAPEARAEPVRRGHDGGQGRRE